MKFSNACLTKLTGVHHRLNSCDEVGFRKQGRTHAEENQEVLRVGELQIVVSN
jgi:hypothetical protein